MSEPIEDLSRSNGKRGEARNYRNPPAQHRFKPGKSGNPNGRPKKKPVLSFDSTTAGMVDRNDQVLLEVIGRPITVREGNKTERVSGLEALYRSMLRKAAEGDASVGRILLQLIERAESRRAAFQENVLVAAMQHLETWNDVFYERELQGKPAPEVYPHPADIEIDFSTGQAIFHPPVTRQEAANRKALEEVTMTSLQRLSEVESELEKDPTNTELKAHRKRLKLFEEVWKQMCQRNIRLQVWRLARAAQAKSSDPPATKKTPRKRQKTSKANNE